MMTMTRILAVACCVALLSAAPPAHAQKKPSKRAVAKAKKHYAAGERHYNLGEFDKAVVEYRAAYDLTERPALLFNIAQAYRLAGDAKQALHFYKTYLRLASNLPNVDYVQSQIAAMEAEMVAAENAERERLAAERERAAADRAAAEKEAAEQERRAAEEERKAEEARKAAAAEQARLAREQARLETVRRGGGDPGGALRVSGYIAGGIGLAVLGTGVALSASASSDFDEVAELIDNGDPWTADAQDTLDSAETRDSVGTWMMVGGGVAVAAGATLWLIGAMSGDDEPETRALTVVPTRGGAAASVTWSF